MAAEPSTVEKELINIAELAAGMKHRITMPASTPAAQRMKDQNLQVWLVRIDEAVVRAIRAIK